MFETAASAALPDLSPDQQAAWDTVAERIKAHGVDLETGEIVPPTETKRDADVLAVLGKAGSGKTVLLAALARALKEAGLKVVSPDWESRKHADSRSFAVLAPTNKAASVLRNKGVAATTIHRIVYTPVYDPEFATVAEWLAGERAERPDIKGMTEEALNRAEAAYKTHQSIPGALAAGGVRGSDFITGWTRREDPLDIALVDEASMLDEAAIKDLSEIFSLIILFGDPAQLAPVGSDGRMLFQTMPEERQLHLARIHRQAEDNPILDLAHALGDPDLTYDDFAGMVREASLKDDRVVIAERADATLMQQSPMLVWRNKTRVRLIKAFRSAHQVPDGILVPGEPLICDGLELPLKRRKERIELEGRGLIKGAQGTYLGPGKKPGYMRVNIHGTDEPGISVASIIQIESPDTEEPILVAAARMGALFLHGAACTIHKAQGSQWPDVQVFAPDLSAAAWSNREESGIKLWKRLAYVAITRAEHRLHWVTRAAISRPDEPLGPAAES